MRHLFQIFSMALMAILLAGQNMRAQDLPSDDEIRSILSESSAAESDVETLDILSAHFLGRPYQTVCGDGPQGRFQQGPVSCFSAFDCVTYVEAVLGLYFMNPSGGLDEYLDTVLNIKYSDSENPCYENRNHFVSLNWMPSQIAKGYLRDISSEILPADYSVRRVLISKRKWYEAKSEKDLQITESLSDEERSERLREFQELGKDEPDVLGELAYIALDDLLKEEVQNQLPDFVLFNLVRGDHRKIHIPVVVGHQGFLVRAEDGSILMRHASPGKGVVDQPLNDYLNEVKTWRTWPILGMNLAAIGTAR